MKASAANRQPERKHFGVHYDTYKKREEGGGAEKHVEGGAVHLSKSSPSGSTRGGGGSQCGRIR